MSCGKRLGNISVIYDEPSAPILVFLEFIAIILSYSISKPLVAFPRVIDLVKAIFKFSLYCFWNIPNSTVERKTDFGFMNSARETSFGFVNSVPGK